MLPKSGHGSCQGEGASRRDAIKKETYGPTSSAMRLPFVQTAYHRLFIQSIPPNRFSIFLIFLVSHPPTAQDENRSAAFLPKHLNTKHKHTKILNFAMVSSQQTAAKLLNLSLIVPP